MTPIPRPFQLHLSDEVLQDLDARLGRVRWPDEPPLEPWSTGTSVAYLRTLVDYWRDRFDWRARRPPRSLAERTYTRIQRWTKAARVGHFAALEQPEVLAREVREFSDHYAARA